MFFALPAPPRSSLFIQLHVHTPLPHKEMKIKIIKNPIRQKIKKLETHSGENKQRIMESLSCCLTPPRHGPCPRVSLITPCHLPPFPAGTNNKWLLG